MRKILPLILLLLFFCDYLNGQKLNIPADPIRNSKSIFDIRHNNSQTHMKSASVQDSKKMASTQVWEYSMMCDGYFTLGTNLGNSEKPIDNNCEITFGHPYSMTSFAYPVIDGNPYFPYELSTNEGSEVQRNNDTLLYEALHADQIYVSTTIYPDEDRNLLLTYKLVNVDAMSHSVGMGFLFDAALGKWGDGFVHIEDYVIENVTKISETIPESLFLWEREQTPKGLGIQIDLSANIPNELVAGNWYNEYSGDTNMSQIYDLALHAKWDEMELLPGSTASFTIRFSLPEPESSNQAFLRWDMPASLSIENQLLFPSNLNTSIEIIKGPETINGLTLNLVESEYVYGWQSEETFNLSTSDIFSFQQATVRIPEIFDSLVVPVTLQLLKTGDVIDVISRNIFIPASPYSDSGLDVVIDTAYTSFGKMCLSFHCTKEETGQLLYQLHKNNVFLYENNQEIEEFILEKDTSGGTNNADIIFVLDVTGSMSNEIAGVRDNIIEFTDSLSFRGIDYRLGMVTFLDEIENIYDFTSDVQKFQMNVSEQYAHGGGDRAENSLDALSAAAQFSFRENANRIIIWITDADFHINNQLTQLTKETVIDQLLAVGITVNCIGDPMFQTDFYDQIVLNTGGGFFNINENFRDIMLEVSRLNQATNHLLSFYHPDPVKSGDVIKVEVHYAGLGGQDSISFGTEPKFVQNPDNTSIIVYPNPFSSSPKMRIVGSEMNSYKVELYNIQGQLLNSKEIHHHIEIIDLDLSDILSPYDNKTSQVFILKTITFSPKGEVLNYETKKIKKL